MTKNGMDGVDIICITIKGNILNEQLQAIIAIYFKFIN